MARDEWRIQTGPGLPVSPRCLWDLRPVHQRFVLSIYLMVVGFRAVVGEGYSESSRRGGGLGNFYHDCLP
jgi:hypothetical protein